MVDCVHVVASQTHRPPAPSNPHRTTPTSLTKHESLHPRAACNPNRWSPRLPNMRLIFPIPTTHALVPQTCA